MIPLKNNKRHQKFHAFKLAIDQKKKPKIIDVLITIKEIDNVTIFLTRTDAAKHLLECL